MVNGGVPEGSMARSPEALIAPALARGDAGHYLIQICGSQTLQNLILLNKRHCGVQRKA